MPRKSQVAREMEALIDHPDPVAALAPPATMSEAGKTAFLALVDSCAPDHFEPCDIGLVAQYAEADALAAKIAPKLHDGTATQQEILLWEKSTRLMSGLALRLRIGPQSRRERAKAPRELTWSERFAIKQQERERHGKKPWE
jgi:hypothetical protein